MFLGGYLTLLLGPTLPAPAPLFLTKTIEQVSVTESDAGRSGFQVTFATGRDALAGAIDQPELLTQLVKVGHRVILVAVINGRPHVLVDGIVTNLQLAPGADAGATKLTATGTDLSALMELVEYKIPQPAMNDQTQALLALAKYSAFLTPVVLPAPGDVAEAPTDSTRTFDGTDYQMLNRLAQKHGYVFYLQPGPVPGTNIGYWGPPVPSPPILQPALTVRMGSATNVTSLSFRLDGDKPFAVAGGTMQDENSGATVPVFGIPTPPLLGLVKASMASAPYMKVRMHKSDEGGNVAKAIAKATADMLESELDAVTASGELDVGRYGTVLRSRQLVGVRGAGLTFDGVWYCTSVNHAISRGSYTQSFQLKRDAILSNTPVVPP